MAVTRLDLQSPIGQYMNMPGRGFFFGIGTGAQYTAANSVGGIAGNPITGETGWAPGAIFINPLTTIAGNYLWTNYGTNTSAKWAPIGGGGVFSNLAATTDPGVSNDGTQGYGPGSVWINTTNGRVWIALTTATGAAAWALAVVPGTGVEPANNLEQFGGGTGTILAEGNIYRQVYAVTAAAGQPASTAADIVIAAYTLPANSFDGTGFRGLNITMSGNFAATGNNKTCKIIFNASTAVVGSAVTGGTTIATTGVSAGNNVGWMLNANVFKYGAANSNTQVAQEWATVVGTTHGGMGLAQAVTATENAAILIAFTGNAATAATDIQMTFAEVNAMN